MTIDSTLEFEKRRNIPVRYDRELVKRTVEAMERIAQIKARREAAFYKARMLKASGGKQTQREKDGLTIHKHAHLKAALSKERQRTVARDRTAAQLQKEQQRRQRQRIRVEDKATSSSKLIPGEGISM